MTEAEWLTTEDSGPMFDFLWDRIGWRKLSERKVALFAVACFRMTPVAKMSESIVYELRRRIEVAEKYIDRSATVEEIRRFWPLRYYQDPSNGNTWPEDPLAWAGSYRACEVHPLVSEKANFFRCIFGNPFRPVSIDPSWLTSTVVALASGIYEEKTFDQMPILADALQDAGCDNNEILNHCRGESVHVRGCFVVDLLTGRK